MKWQIGQDIWIKCAAKPGAFSNERLIIIQSQRGPVSGFVDKSELRGDGNGGSLIEGRIRDFTCETIDAWVSGSFFTTNGLVKISPDEAVATVG